MQTRTHGHQAAALACLLLPLTALSAHAQWKCPADNRTACQDLRDKLDVTETHFLHNVPKQNDANEVLVALRNMMDPSIKIFLLASDNAIVVKAPPEDQTFAQHLIDDLTKPRPIYHLVFTFTSTQDGKRLPAEHAELDANAGERATLKQGAKIPVLTGSYNKAGDSAGQQTQFTYLDVGMNIDATPTPTGPNSVALKVKIERSEVGPEKPSSQLLSALINDPAIDQSVVETETSLTLGKPVKLGSVDLANRHTDIEVVAAAR